MIKADLQCFCYFEDVGYCPVKLGMMSNRLQSGVNCLQGFREDKRNRITPGNFYCFDFMAATDEMPSANDQWVMHFQCPTWTTDLLPPTRPHTTQVLPTSVKTILTSSTPSTERSPVCRAQTGMWPLTHSGIGSERHLKHSSVITFQMLHEETAAVDGDFYLMIFTNFKFSSAVIKKWSLFRRTGTKQLNGFLLLWISIYLYFNSVSKWVYVKGIITVSSVFLTAVWAVQFFSIVFTDLSLYSTNKVILSFSFTKVCRKQ